MDHSISQRTSISKVEELKDRLAPQIDQVRDQVAVYTDQAATYIRANPVPSIIGAVVAGFLIGRLVSKI